MNYYRAAREIFQTLPKGAMKKIEAPDGEKVRMALFQVVKRNPLVDKQFKTKAKDGAVIIWRKI